MWILSEVLAVFATVFGLPYVSGQTRSPMDSTDLESGRIAARSPAVDALFRRDANVSASSSVESVCGYPGWKLSL